MNDYTPPETLFLECSCYSPSHTLKITNDIESEMVYVSVHLPTKNFLRRILAAVRHILGHKSKYGDWDEFILKSEDKQKLIDLLSK